MDENALKVLDMAQSEGCSYCDVRVESTDRHGVLIENGQQEHSLSRSDEGIGVRVLFDGAWGFYSTTNYAVLEKGLRDTIRAAKHNALKKKVKVKLADIPIIEKNVRYETKKKADFESLSQIALDCDRAINENSQIVKSSVTAINVQTSKFFASSEGARILQEFSDVTVDMVATAHAYGITQSVNRTEGGRGGLETITGKSDVIPVARHVSAKACELLDAGTVKEDKTAVIMNPDFVALLTHEILGHPSEADRVLGKEMAWAGGAWWTGMLGHQVGSNDLNVIDDPTIRGSLGWYEFDDEGTPSRRKQLINEGRLAEHMHSRETAHIFDTEPNSSMRATSYQFMPLIRMACTCIEGGDWKTDEMIKDVKHGYLISDMKVPSIDMRRHDWSISCQYANRIENGQVAETIRDVIVVGSAPEFFRSIDARGNDFTVRPITNCGKGDPMQQMKMGNGGPSIRGVATVRSVGT